MQKRRHRKSASIAICAFLLAFGGLNPAAQNMAQAGPAAHAVINEIQVDSVVGTGGTDDDWVELFNPTAAPVVLDGWSLQKTSSSGSSLSKQTLSGTIPASGYFLIVKDGASTTPELKQKADLLAASSFSLASNNIVYLVNDNSNIASSTGDPNIVDFVGFGTASYFEGSAAAPNAAEAKSITRSPDGEDTDRNSIDFILQDTPTPANSAQNEGDNIGGDVLLTVQLSADPITNLNANGADINFSVNADASAQVLYGLTDSYGSSTVLSDVIANNTNSITLAGLACDKTYHYSVYAEKGGGNDQTPDGQFKTLPCGIAVTSLAMTRTGAKASNNYADGWEWKFNISVWDMGEQFLKMKFSQWNGPNSLDAGGNMQYSVDNGSTWTDIISNNSYSAIGAHISGIDKSTNAGRQVEIVVRMKVPAGTLMGHYSANYGILTE